MKWVIGFVVVLAVFSLLSAAIAFGADVGVIGDMRILETITGLSYPLKLDNQDITIGGTTTGVLFSTGGSGAERGKGALIYETTGTWNRGSFHFLQEPSPNMLNPTITNAVLTIRNDGNVGIGKTDPGVKLDVTGWIRARTGYGDSISIGGDSSGGDVEIQISAPAERNKISLWNSQLQSGVDLGVRTISAENMNITGSITTAPKTSYFSISPHAFHIYSNCALNTYPPYIYFSGDPRFQCYAYAPVNLPHGATITKFTSYWYYNADTEWGADAKLFRARLSEYNDFSEMTNTYVNGRINAMREVSDTTIVDPVVDNQNYSNHIEMRIWSYVAQADAQFYGVVIEYVYSSP